jgi:hypothetical protein
MLVFNGAQDAVAAGSALLASAGWHEPAPHIGAYSGTVIERDGDLIGGTAQQPRRRTSP